MQTPKMGFTSTKQGLKVNSVHDYKVGAPGQNGSSTLFLYGKSFTSIAMFQDRKDPLGKRAYNLPVIKIQTYFSLE